MIDLAMVATSHYNIFMYWYNKFILSSGEILTQYTKDAIPIVSDSGEPCCWGCDKPIVSKFEGQEGEYECDYLLKKIWNDPNVKRKYHRCHIIPGSLGGEDKPENLFLMCPSCHYLSPDTDNPRSFFRWVYSQRMKYICGKLAPAYTISCISEELKKRGLPPVEELLKHGDFISEDTQSLKSYCKQHMGIHASSCVDSSLISTTTDWIISEFVKACLT